MTFRQSNMIVANVFVAVVFFGMTFFVTPIGAILAGLVLGSAVFAIWCRGTMTSRQAYFMILAATIGGGLGNLWFWQLPPAPPSPVFFSWWLYPVSLLAAILLPIGAGFGKKLLEIKLAK